MVIYSRLKNLCRQVGKEIKTMMKYEVTAS